MGKYGHANWNQVLELTDGDDKTRQLKIVGFLAKGNMQAFARRLMGKEDDRKVWGNAYSAQRSKFLDYMERL